MTLRVGRGNGGRQRNGQNNWDWWRKNLAFVGGGLGYGACYHVPFCSSGVYSVLAFQTLWCDGGAYGDVYGYLCDYACRDRDAGMRLYNRLFASSPFGLCGVASCCV